MRRLGQTGQMRVDGGGGRTDMTEVHLDLAQVLSLLQQMSRVTVTQTVNMTGLLDPAFLQSLAEGQLKGASVQGSSGGRSSRSAPSFGGKE